MVICDEKGLTGYGADGQTTRFDVEDPVKVPVRNQSAAKRMVLARIDAFCAVR